MVDKAVPKNFTAQEEDDEEGRDGASGEIGFSDFLQGGKSRDDLLSSYDQKILLNEHRGFHENLVKKQKSERQNRQQKSITSGSVLSGPNSEVNVHPILGKAVQFSGADPETTPLPDENKAKTNSEPRLELEATLKPRYQPGPATPRNTPKPM